jgi:cell division protein FtsW
MSVGQVYVPGTGDKHPAAVPAKPNRKAELRIWWREIDRVLLVLVLMLMAIGMVAVAAASPASARRLSTAGEKLSDLHFYWLHMQWQLAGLAVMLGVSTLPRELARRGAVIAAAAMLGALLLVPLVGPEVNGARRWLELGIRFQPSEFLKPALIVTLAWILSWRVRDPKLPVIGLSGALTGFVALLLMLQPNLGDTLLFGGVWFVLVLLSGMKWQKIALAAAVTVFALVMAYLFYGNARHRIDTFLFGEGAFDQVGLAARTLEAGGWTGTGLWLGVRKLSLPEAHTDYIFSVIGEEFGLIVCGVIVLLYLAIVLRVLYRLIEEEDLFKILAASGLASLIGGQAFINILVNLQLFPSKGMTLPLVSYGGSSTLAVCATVGLLLALTRRNPYLTRERFDWLAALEQNAPRAGGQR